MSGHSRWSQIKHKKAIADAKKGAVFGKLGRMISVAARDNPDPSTNLRLKAEIDRARAFNMPNENIERAVRRFSDKSASALTEVQLEFIGPAHTAVVVEAITDNSNRTINELRQLALQHGAHMADRGSVSWMFKKAGVVRFSGDADDELQLRLIDAGADDVHSQDGWVTIYTAPDHLNAVTAAAQQPAATSGIELVATTTVSVPEGPAHGQLEALLEAMDDHDDVQTVFCNAEY